MAHESWGSAGCSVGAVGARALRGGRNVAFGSVSLAPAPLSVMKGLLSDVCRLGGEGRAPQTEKSWGLALNRFPWSWGSSQQWMKDGGGRGERKRRLRRGWQQVENEAEHTGVLGVMKPRWGAAEFTELTPETQGADANAAGAAAGTSCEPRSSPRAAPVAGVPSSGEGRTGDPGTGERP